MSRIGKKSIEIPEGVSIVIDGKRIAVQGPRGRLEKEIPDTLVLTREGNKLFLHPLDRDKVLKPVKSLWGTFHQHIVNMIEGVTKGFAKKLTIEGVGYRVNVIGSMFEAEVGYTTASKLAIPPGLDVSFQKGVISVAGLDKEMVGQFASKIRSLRTVEPYKGKGIKYESEVVKKKLGKRAATAAPGAAGSA